MDRWVVDRLSKKKKSEMQMSDDAGVDVLSASDDLDVPGRKLGSTVSNCLITCL